MINIWVKFKIDALMLSNAMNIDYIIKIGWSLFSDAKKLQLLLIKLENSRLNAAYTVGAGYLGDVFKKYLVYNKIAQNFSSSIKCLSNIQSINASTICDTNLSFVTCINFKKLSIHFFLKHVLLLIITSFMNALKFLIIKIQALSQL